MGRRKITDEANSSTDTAEDNEDEEREQLTQRMPSSLVNQVDEVADELVKSRNASVNLSFHKERIPPFTAGVNPTLADQSTDDTLTGYSTVIHNY